MGLREDGDVVITGDLHVMGSINPPIARTSLAQETLSDYVIAMTEWATWDDMSTPLPNAGATDDLGLVHGYFGTNSPSLQTGDLKSAGATTRYARAQVIVPHEYVAGQTLELRFVAGVITTVADVSCTLDAEVFLSDGETGIGADICATAAKSINGGVSFANYDFSITPATLSPGDVLDVRIAIACDDGSGATAVIGCVGQSVLRCDTKG